MKQILGIDVGGSGIKGALVDIDKGKMITERIRIDTPPSFQIEEVAETIGEIYRHFDYNGPVGVGFPSVVYPKTGIVGTPPTAHHYPGWVGLSVSDAIAQKTGSKVVVVNDADAAGLAEIHFGAGRGVSGTVLVLTLGTGVGSGLFFDGQLIPNTEFGKVYLKGQSEVAEQYMAGRIKEELKLKWKEYGPRLNEYLQHMEWLFSPELMIVGGGISKKFNRFSPYFDLRSRVVRAKLENEAGIVGAAAAAI